MKSTILEQRWNALRPSRQLGVLALVVLAMMACVTGCAAPIVTTAPAGCSGLIPSSWREGVAPAPLPEGDTVGDWIAALDAQTGKLDQANGRTKDAVDIVSRCEERDAAAVKKAVAPWWKRIF